MPFCKMILIFVCGLIVSRAKLSLELLALRQQLVVLRRTVGRPQIQNRDRWFWIVVSRIWKDRQQALIVVKPETVIKWHRQGFKMYWRWKSRSSQVGRPKLAKEIRDLIRRMSDENPLWGVPRIQSDLGLLGYEVAESTAAIRRLFCWPREARVFRNLLDRVFNRDSSLYGITRVYLAGLFPVRVRYSGISFGYQMAGTLGGGIARLSPRPSSSGRPRRCLLMLPSPIVGRLNVKALD